MTTDQKNLGPYKSEGLNRKGLRSPEVTQAMSRVPRHEFVPEEQQPHAYEDRALSIGAGQTISQPYIVALMTEQAGVTQGSKVLEIGTGSGYQAAVFAELGATVYTIEILKDLADSARSKLERLGYGARVHVLNGDGWAGWPSEAPFDAIVITAASPRVPAKLLSQLANHGRMVVPIEAEGRPGERLVVVERDDQNFSTRDLGAVKFVPLLGEARSESVAPTITESVLGITPAKPTPSAKPPIVPFDNGAVGSAPPKKDDAQDK
ncbi:MAG: protein-L-isoaspartate(D-aspartate) O-methyltransferase [Bdellovibrionota bacterium]